MAYTFEKDLKYSQNPYLMYGNTPLNNLEDDNIEVNTTLKPIDRKDANMEVEKSELILKTDGSINRALGKIHSEGGTPVNLPEGSFVFSNFKPLSISQKDKELFKMGSGGKVKDNTPAKLLQREVDIKHHNQMIAIGDSKKHDTISKKSAELMLQKNFKKVGQIAYLQEEKKGFPDGLPDFSQGTAPVQDPQQAQQEVMSKQFMQIGGKVWQGDKYSGRKNATAYSQDQWDRFARNIGFKGGSPEEFQKYMNDYNNGEFRPLINDLHKAHLPGPTDGRFDGKIGYRWDAIYKAGQPQTIRPDHNSPDIAPPNLAGLQPSATIPNTTIQNPYTSPEQPNVPVRPYESNIGFTPSQKLDLGNSLYNAVSINKYAPKREQASFTPVNLERDNVQPYLNDIDNNIQQGYKATSTMSPIQARAQNSQMFGRGLEAKSQARGQVFSRNSQISNQENLYNNQGVNRTAEENMGLDNKYYDQVQRMNQDFDNESRFSRNQVADKYLKHISDNQALSMGIMSQPFGTIDKTDKNGNPYKQASPLFDFNYQTGKPFYTGVSMSLDQIPTGREEDVESMFKRFVAQGIEPKDAMRSAVYYVTKTQANNRQRNPYKG